jgi:hypothetical protein
MKKQLVFIAIFALLVGVGLSGCEQFNDTRSNEKNKFVGTWQNTTGYPAVIDFFSNGTCVYGGETGTWELRENKLSIGLLDSGLIFEYNYWFSNSDRTLLLTRTLGYSIIYTKQ